MTQARPGKMRSTSASPKSILRMYENFVTENASSVSQIESALRSLTYIIPGRFREAEIASESCEWYQRCLLDYLTWP